MTPFWLKTLIGSSVAASGHDAQGELRRTAALHQLGDLVPVDAPRVCLGERRGDAEAPQLEDAPAVHRRLVMLDRLVPGARLGRFHRSASRPRRITEGQPRCADVITAVAGLDGGMPLT